MKITSLNYEKYVIDFLEGELSPEAHTAFQQYLLQHPEVQDEISDYLTSPTVPMAAVAYPHTKQLLRKSKSRIWWMGFIVLALAGLSIALFTSRIGVSTDADLYMAQEEANQDTSDDINQTMTPRTIESTDKRDDVVALATDQHRSPATSIDNDVDRAISQNSHRGSNDSNTEQKLKSAQNKTQNKSSKSTSNSGSDVEQSAHTQDVASLSSRTESNEVDPTPSIDIELPMLRKEKLIAERKAVAVATIPSVERKTLTLRETRVVFLPSNDDMILGDYSDASSASVDMRPETEVSSLRELLLPQTFRDLDDEIDTSAAEDVKKILRKENRSKLKALFLPKALVKA